MQINNYFKSIGLYSFASLYFAGTTFLIIPFLTRVLSSSDFGIIFLFQSCVAIFSSVIGLGSVGVIQSLFHKLGGQVSLYISSALLSSFLIWFFFLCLIFLFKDVFLMINLPFQYGYLALIVSFLFFLQSLSQGMMQIKEEPKKYLSLVVAVSSFTFISSLIFLYLYQNLNSRIFGIAAGLIIAAFISTKYLKKLRLVKPSKDGMKLLLSLGFPIIFHSLSMLFINQTDKILISNMLGLSEVGMYGLAAQFASVISVVGGAVALAYNPKLFKALSTENISIYKKVSLLRIKTMSLFALFSLIITTFLFFSIKFIIGKDFIFNFNIFLILASAYLMFGFYHFFSGYFYYYKKTKTLALITGFIALSNLVFSYMLIQQMGIIGAAIGTISAYFLGLVIAIMRSKKYLKLQGMYSE